ncbi:sensor histidine kinase [Nocardiopsis aegyptia]|uniref:histidine kinase n=1 Tax=Nocardiopsis aegyptia TaxID=220378 RepID=A0A7Z0EUD1_9ACTN|nr:sensor histidine kinase [Nocardiopsis aegyptia]NYJ38097.1 signal transduction histidine kinase [Nocardiopsis aegyptia]
MDRPPAPESPTTREDLALAIALVPLALLNRLFDSPWWLLAAAASLLVVAVAGRRRRPWPALAATTALALWSANAVLAAAVVAFGIGRRGVRPAGRTSTQGQVLRALLATALAGALATLVWRSPTLSLGSLALLPLPVVLAWAAGDHLRTRAELRRRERHGVADQARRRERERIAQDMHDSLGHEIGLLAVRAGALEVAPDPTPESTRAAATDLRLGAARAAERLRQVIGVLGAHDPHAPAPQSTAELVERARASGMRVHCRTTPDTGTEPGDAVPDLVERTVHRLVQEALTNAAKHAPGARVDIEVQHACAHTALTVTNDAPADPPPTAPPGTGTGLVGLRERVRLAGGTLSAAPLGEGFQVRAHLPHTPATTAPAPAAADPGREDALPPHLAAHAWRRLRWDLARTVVITTALTCAVAGLAALYGW